MNSNDPVSYSQNAVQQKHLDFKVSIDMERKRLYGRVRIYYTCKKNSNFIALDTRDLRIYRASTLHYKQLPFKLIKRKDKDSNLGKGLLIVLPDKCRRSSYIDVYYSTTRKSLGIHFSDRKVLNNSKYGFMYTHGEAIYTRTFAPCQDSPSLRVSTSALIKIKRPYNVLFSGKLIKRRKRGNYFYYYFRLKQTIPTYLITFSAGVLKTHKIANSRCRVHGEKEVMNKKIIDFDFEYCEKYMRYFEKNYGKFYFDRMEFLILPRDSPYSGMENPYVVFIAESIVTGDRSLSSTIAHEIAHFWSGNLVTNANWKHFWLNEGITTYISRKALKEIHSIEDYYLNMRHGLKRLSWALKSVRNNGKVDSTFRSMNPNVKNFDPYVAFSSVPYEKGNFLLYYIERLIGNKNINAILKKYFKTYRFRSITTRKFVNLFNREIKRFVKNRKIMKKKVHIPWKKWIYGTGMIPAKFKFQKLQSVTVKNAKKWILSLLNKNVNHKELTRKFKIFTVRIKGKILSTVKRVFRKLSKKTKIVFYRFLQNKYLFRQIRLKCLRSMILYKYTKGRKNKIAKLIHIFDKMRYYSVAFVKTILRQLKKLNVPKRKLLLLLNKFKSRLHPLTMMRAREFVLHHK